MDRCSICGLEFASSQEFEKHMAAHADPSKQTPVDEQESMLLKKADEEEMARKRTRGPYRKSHAA